MVPIHIYKKILWLLVLVTLISSSQVVQAVDEFEAVNLGIPTFAPPANSFAPGIRCYACDINGSGEIAGTFWTGASFPNGDEIYHAFVLRPQNGVWFQDTDNDLINDFLDDISNGTTALISKGYSINDTGKIAGYAKFDGFNGWLPFLWEQGALDLPKLANHPTTGLSEPKFIDVNNSNTVAGTRDILLFSDRRIGFLWSNNATTDLEFFNLVSGANALNSSGQTIFRGSKSERLLSPLAVVETS